jgi:hypothetical protein
VQVARQLVNMHNQVAAGDFSYVQHLQQQQQAAAQAAAASQRAPNGLPEADEDSSSSGEEDGEDGEEEGVGACCLSPMTQGICAHSCCCGECTHLAADAACVRAGWQACSIKLTVPISVYSLST